MPSFLRGVRTARHLRSVVCGLVLGALVASGAVASAQASTGTPHAPVVRLTVPCSRAVTKSTMRSIFLTKATAAPRSSSRTVRSAAARQAGYWSCSWSGRQGESLTLQGLPSGSAGFRAVPHTRLASDAVFRRTSTSLVRCSSSSATYLWECDIDLLVHGVWLEAQFATPPGDARGDQTLGVIRDLRRAFFSGAAGSRWKRPKTAWHRPSSCAALDPQNRVGAAAGFTVGTVEQGENGVDTHLGQAVLDRSHLFSCTWWSDDYRSSLSAVFVPGASWAHPLGRTVSTRSIGRGALRARSSDDDGSHLLDVVTKGGWFELQSSEPLATEVAAAKQLNALLH